MISSSSSTFYFHNEDINFELDHASRTIQWLTKLIESHGFSISEINYIFCSDEYLLEINKDYLDHDYYTDIITFALQSDPIEADIFISIDRIHDNAKTEQVSFENELLRVMVHGILHLVGFDDKTDEMKSIMREKENEAINNYYSSSD